MYGPFLSMDIVYVGYIVKSAYEKDGQESKQEKSEEILWNYEYSKK